MYDAAHKLKVLELPTCFKKSHPLFVCAITYFMLNRFG